jgi:hypothetical protein
MLGHPPRTVCTNRGAFDRATLNKPVESALDRDFCTARSRSVPLNAGAGAGAATNTRVVKIICARTAIKTSRMAADSAQTSCVRRWALVHATRTCRSDNRNVPAETLLRMPKAIAG